MTRKIALVGTTNSGEAAPFDDQSWEIWGCSERFHYVTRATRWFELHRLDGESGAWVNEWRERMHSWAKDVELIMFYPEHDLGENVVQYPTDRITGRFGTYFMTSSFAWMIALAIDELRPCGEEAIDGEIAIYGIDMEYDTEYREQRAGFRHFIDMARAWDIPVTRLADGGLIYDPVPYPFWQDDPLLSKLALRSKRTLRDRSRFEDHLERVRGMLNSVGGALSEIEQFQKKGYEPNKAQAALEKERGNLLKESGELSRKITLLDGENNEQLFFKDYLTP